MTSPPLPEPFLLDPGDDAERVPLSLRVLNGDPGRERPPVVLCHGFPELAAVVHRVADDLDAALS